MYEKYNKIQHVCYFICVINEWNMNHSISWRRRTAWNSPGLWGTNNTCQGKVTIYNSPAEHFISPFSSLRSRARGEAGEGRVRSWILHKAVGKTLGGQFKGFMGHVSEGVSIKPLVPPPACTLPQIPAACGRIKRWRAVYCSSAGTWAACQASHVTTLE